MTLPISSFGNWDSCVFSAVEACDYDVRFPSLSQPCAAVEAWHDETFAVFAYLISMLFRQANLCRHSDFSRDFHVFLCCSWVSME